MFFNSPCIVDCVLPYFGELSISNVGFLNLLSHYRNQSNTQNTSVICPFGLLG